MLNKYISKNLDETSKIAKDLSRMVSAGDIILLTGDLGAGKTAFTRCLCENLGVEDVVSSPSFTIVKEYNAKDFKVYHIDLYRLSSEDELIEIGFEEIVNDAQSLKIIEWPELGKDYYLGYKTIKINISILQNEERVFEVEYENIGDWHNY